MNISKQHKEILEKFVTVAPSVIFRHFKNESCVISTRVTLEVLKKLHFKNVKTVAVEVSIYNPIYASKGRLPETQQEAEAWKDEGAWQVVIGDRSAEAPKGYWSGHIVNVVNNMTLIDLSLMYANYPEKNIEMRPIATTVPESFLEQKDACGLTVNNCLVVYKLVNDVSYQGVSDWSNKQRVMPAVNDIISEMKHVTLAVQKD